MGPAGRDCEGFYEHTISRILEGVPGLPSPTEAKQSPDVVSETQDDL